MTRTVVMHTCKVDPLGRRYSCASDRLCEPEPVQPLRTDRLITMRCTSLVPS